MRVDAESGAAAWVRFPAALPRHWPAPASCSARSTPLPRRWKHALTR